MGRPKTGIKLIPKRKMCYDYHIDPIDKQNIYNTIHQIILERYKQHHITIFSTKRLCNITGLTGHNIYKNAIKPMLDQQMLVLDANPSRAYRWRLNEEKW